MNRIDGYYQQMSIDMSPKHFAQINDIQDYLAQVQLNHFLFWKAAEEQAKMGQPGAKPDSTASSDPSGTATGQSGDKAGQAKQVGNGTDGQQDQGGTQAQSKGGNGPAPLLYGFDVPEVRDAGSVRGELFIQTATADPFGVLKGDNRGFDIGPNPQNSRVSFEFDFETGQGSLRVNPTCTSSGECTAPLPLGGGNNVVLGVDGNTVTLAGTFKNSVLPASPAIDFAISVSASAQGVTFSGSRDRYPSFELTRTTAAATDVLYTSTEVSGVCLTGICGTERF